MLVPLLNRPPKNIAGKFTRLLNSDAVSRLLQGAEIITPKPTAHYEMRNKGK
jgi:hypothetical protein